MSPSQPTPSPAGPVRDDDPASQVRDDNLRLILSKGHEAWLARRRANLVKAMRESAIGMVVCTAWLAATPLFIAANTRLAQIDGVPEWVAVAFGVIIGLITLVAPFAFLIAIVDWGMNRVRLSRADREEADHVAFLARYGRG